MGRPEAVVAVLRNSHRFLIIERGPQARAPGYWGPPSGRIEPGETQRQAVVREMREELGVDVSPVEKVWECDTDDGVFRIHWWTAAISSTDLTPDPGEVSAVRWVTPEDFLHLEATFKGDREFVRTVYPTLT